MASMFNAITDKFFNNNTEEPNDLIEVYILYKILSQDRYINETRVSHHICLLKSRNNKFYYTDLNPDERANSGALSKIAPIHLRFGEYGFHPTRNSFWFSKKYIWYKPVGKIQIKFNEMKKFVEQHSFRGTDYRLLFKSNNCQDYVTSCLQFLKSKNEFEKVYNGVTFTSSDYIYGVLDSSEIRLDPPLFFKYGGQCLKDGYRPLDHPLLPDDSTMLYVGEISKLNYWQKYLYWRRKESDYYMMKFFNYRPWQ